MMRFLGHGLSVLGACAALMGTAMAPAASAAPADDPVLCPRVVGVCTYSQPDGQGELRVYFADEPLADPLFRTVQNQTPEPWCVYAAPYFGGDQQQVDPRTTIRNLPFDAASLRAGEC